MLIQLAAIGRPDRLPANPGVPYNPPGQWRVTKYCYFLYLSSENRQIEAPLADNPYLWGSKLIDVIP